MSTYCKIEDAMHPRRNVLAIILRWVVGATFLFSGLAKGVDPVGTSIYVEKYLATYSLEALMPISEALAVALSVVEALLGVLLIMGTLRRITTIISLVIVAIFTVVTLLSATVLPIGECGCFGSIY
jgi:triosephosphate isomerase